MKHVSPDEAVVLLQELVRIRTVNPPGGEKAAATYLADRIAGFGLEPRVTDLSPGRANVTTTLPGSGAAPPFLFNGHLDVVPPGEQSWDHPPFDAVIAGDRLFGRGACDMKAGLAAMLLALVELHRGGERLAGDLIFSAVADEEISALGAQSLARDPDVRRASAVIIGEPTAFEIVIAEKGTYWVDLETRGRTAHGSTPEAGRNAVVDMHGLLGEILAMDLPKAPDPWHGPSTLNVGTIAGGVSPNVVPDRCRVQLDIRIPPGIRDATVRALVEAAIARASAARPGMDARIAGAAGRPAVATARDERVVAVAVAACAAVLGRRPEPRPVSYATDASVLCHDPLRPFVVIGPGSPGMAHKPDEYVDIPDFLQAVDLYAAIARRFLGT